MLVFWAAVALSKTKCPVWGLVENKRKSSSVGGVLPTGAVSEKKAIALPIVVARSSEAVRAPCGFIRRGPAGYPLFGLHSGQAQCEAARIAFPNRLGPLGDSFL